MAVSIVVKVRVGATGLWFRVFLNVFDSLACWLRIDEYVDFALLVLQPHEGSVV